MKFRKNVREKNGNCAMMRKMQILSMGDSINYGMFRINNAKKVLRKTDPRDVADGMLRSMILPFTLFLIFS